MDDPLNSGAELDGLYYSEIERIMKESPPLNEFESNVIAMLIIGVYTNRGYSSMTPYWYHTFRIVMN
jgi:hypothetical protein